MCACVCVCVCVSACVRVCVSGRERPGVLWLSLNLCQRERHHTRCRLVWEVAGGHPVSDFKKNHCHLSMMTPQGESSEDVYWCVYTRMNLNWFIFPLSSSCLRILYLGNSAVQQILHANSVFLSFNELSVFPRSMSITVSIHKPLF